MKTDFDATKIAIPSAAQRQSLKVLIVDDNASSREVLVELLRTEGHASFEAADGEQALAFLENQKIDAVISDVIMPLMNGYQLCHKIRGDKRFKDVPVIIYSGTLISPTSEKVASDLGAVRFLKKPAPFGAILATLREVLVEAEGRREQTMPIEVPQSLPSGKEQQFLQQLEAQNRHFQDVTERLLQAHQEILTLSVALKQSEESLIEKNAQLEEDLKLARETQLALLPRSYPCIPKGTPYEERALRFHQRFAPKGAVSGDFFDVPALSDTKSAIFICDVMGHGVRAALVTAVIRGILSELARVLSDPGEVLAEINRKLVPILGQAGAPMFASAFYMTVDAASGEIQYANAGHPCPFLIRRETGAVERLGLVGREHGPALGFIEELQYPTGKRVLEPHDLVLLFTDGIFDASGADEEPFGEERLLNIVRCRIGMPPEQLFDELLAEVHQFSSTNDFEDDVCLVGMEVDHLCP
jgi:serine phosphatase RsbU (regulator of sigma subunit)